MKEAEINLKDIDLESLVRIWGKLERWLEFYGDVHPGGFLQRSGDDGLRQLARAISHLSMEEAYYKEVELGYMLLPHVRRFATRTGLQFTYDLRVVRRRAMLDTATCRAMGALSNSISVPGFRFFDPSRFGEFESQQNGRITLARVTTPLCPGDVGALVEEKWRVGPRKWVRYISFTSAPIDPHSGADLPTLIHELTHFQLESCKGSEQKEPVND